MRKEFAIEGGRARLSAIWPDVLRLRAAREKFGPDRSFAIDRLPPAAKGAASLAFEGTGFKVLDEVGRVILSGREAGFKVGQPTIAIELQERDRIFGLGETTGGMNKRGLVRELWNIDILGHTKAIYPGLKSLYVSIPFAIILRDGRACGIFWDNPGRQVWDMGGTKGDELRVSAETGELNIYFFAGPTVEGIVKRFAELTGRMPMPPRWGLGFHQCRYSYMTQERVLEVARNFREKQIPCDALYLDIDHMRGYRVFTFNNKFPRPAEMTKDLAAYGFRTVAIVDPGVKNDPQFGVLQRGLQENAFVKRGKEDYVGRVWPGRVKFPDFYRKSVRQWWAREQQVLHRAGVAGVWNDMNEPANFALKTKTLPLDCVHETEIGPKTHLEVHNAYGSEMAKASRAGVLKARPTERPFVITRDGYAGVQKHALVWTGDNSSNWEHLADSISMLLNLSVSGVPFCGADVGGFLDSCNGELLGRWMMLGAFTPFFRNHSNIGTRDQEPWCFGEEIEAVCRGAIQMRYQLLPYIYALFDRAARDGTPIMRPLWWHYQNDPQCAATQDEFLLGESLLVAPVIQPGAQARSVYLPPGTWHDFWSPETFRGRAHVLAEAPLSRIPLYLKAGAIVPFVPVAQHTGEYSAETVTLQIWPGADGSFEFYDDDGISIAGEFYRRRIEWRDRDPGGVIRFHPPTGKWKAPKVWRIIAHRITRRARVLANGAEIEAHRDRDMEIVAFEVENSRDIEIVIA